MPRYNYAIYLFFIINNESYVSRMQTYFAEVVRTTYSKRFSSPVL